MRRNPGVCVGALLIISCAAAFGQIRSGSEFQVTKISRNLISTPQYSYRGAEQFGANQEERWLEVEAEFTSTPGFTDELMLKYFILFGGKVLLGEVTHVNVPGGRENRSVMYVSPRALARFAGNRAVELNAVQNVAVQIVKEGVVKDELSLVRAQPQWFARVAQIPGFVLNKNETPFAPLYWDRYQQIKALSR